VLSITYIVEKVHICRHKE